VRFMVVGARWIERWRIAPRIFAALRTSRRALPFRLGRQPAARPRAIRRGLEPTDARRWPVRVLFLPLPILGSREPAKALDPVFGCLVTLVQQEPVELLYPHPE